MDLMVKDVEAADSGLSPVARIARIAPLLDEYAERAEREGRIADPVLSALKASGLFRLTAATRVGGAGAPIRQHVEVVAEIAKSCPGTAWAFGILAAATGTAASLPAAQTDAIFRRGDELVCFIGAKTGVAIPVEGGYRVTGEWRYGSGCLHADWAMCGVRIQGTEGDPPVTGTAFVDLSDTTHVEIVHDWLVAGLSGSGSNQVRVRDHFVAAHLLLVNLVSNESAAAAPAVGGEPRDSWPVEIQFPLTVLPSMLGAAEGMLSAVQAKMNDRPVLGWAYPHQSDSHQLLAKLGDAAMKIESAWLHIRVVCDLMDKVAPVRSVTKLEKVKSQAACGYAMGLLREATTTLMDIAGPSAFATASKVQRHWRDINMGTRHNALNTGFSLELLGRALAGQPSNFDVIPKLDAVEGTA